MSRLQLFSQLPSTDEELHDHIVALSRMANAKEHQEIFDHLYGCLSILDSKSSSLLTFNSIIIAVFAIFMAGELRLAEWLPVVLGMALVLVSSLLLLWVVWIHWSTTKDLSDLEQHAIILLRVRRARTVNYRLAWYFAVASLTCLSSFLVITTLRRPWV